MTRKKSTLRYIFDTVNICVMLFVAVITIYPIWHVIMASFSEGNLLMEHSGILLKPLGFQVEAYRLMMKNPMIVRGYINTIFIVVAGVALNLLFTTVAAYFLSRKNVYWQKLAMMLIVVTMYFSGGLIPSYLNTSQTFGLYNSYLALLLPTLINTYNLIIMKTSFMAIPDALEEAARIDGAGHVKILFRIIVPMSLPILAVMTLYYAVGHWNSWFSASIYIKDRIKYPLQLILREILISNDTSSMTQDVSAMDQISVSDTVKYAVVVVATLPILCVYPFLQKYFVKGALVGAVKE